MTFSLKCPVGVGDVTLLITMKMIFSPTISTTINKLPSVLINAHHFNNQCHCQSHYVTNMSIIIAAKINKNCIHTLHLCCIGNTLFIMYRSPVNIALSESMSQYLNLSFQV